MPDLDDRIRSLVAAAVADAPAAPDVDTAAAPATPQRGLWLRRGALALAALVAAAGGVAVLQPADDSDSDVDTVQPTPTTTPAAPVPEPSVLVIAGPNGVREVVDGEERVVTTEPMVMALALGNGDVVAQRKHYNEERSSGVAAVPILITADGATTPLFDESTVKGPVDLQDFSIVDGHRILLYSVYEPDAGPPEAIPAWRERLYAYDLDTKVATELAWIGGWESSVSRMHLGSNGLIIGTQHGLVGSGTFFAAALPGSPAASRPLPKATDYGLVESRGDDGCVCPTNYVVDSAGATLFWVGPEADGEGTALYSAPVDQPGATPTMVTDLPENGGPTGHATFVDIGQNSVVASFYQPWDDDGPSHAPVRVRDDVVEDLDGYVATFGPKG